MISNVPPTFYLAGLLGLGIAAQWLAWRVRLPAIVLLLATGFAVGQFVEPPAQFDDDDVLFPLVSLAVGVILFEGGLSLRLSEVRETGAVVARLVTVGLIVTWLLSALAAWWILGFSPEMSALIGALLTVSGPTVILPLIRHVRPTPRVGSLIKWEGIVNDPIGAVLAALVFEVIAHGQSTLMNGHWLVSLALTVVVGFVLAALGAWLIIYVLKHYLVPDYLQNPVFLALVVLLFAASNYCQPESGLITVTLMGIILANQTMVTIHHVIAFKENLRVLLIAMLFIVLASRLELSPEILASIGWPSLLFVAVLIVVVRPLAAMLATLGSELTWRERLLVCWIHPRGIVAAAVASLFALKLRDTRFAVEAQQFVFVTFAVIFGTVFVYGFTMGPLARRLGLSRSSPQGIMFVGASPWVRELALAVQAEEVPVLLVDNNPQKISAARLAGLPVCLGSIGSEFVQEQLDLGDIGRLIAATPNDEVNTFASMEFVENFGRAGVFQLAPREASHQRYERIPTHLRGRLLFSKEATFDQLEKRFHDGQQIKKTVLTEEFTFEHFRERYGESALIVFVVDENDRLQIRTAGDTTVPKPDQKVIALVHEVENLS